MIKLDWTIPAAALTLSGVFLIWFKSKLSLFKSKSAKTEEDEHTEKLLQSVYSKLLQLLDEEKIYLHKNIKVADLASRLNQNEKTISRAINKHSKGNFNAFINSFRVKYSKDLLQSGKLDHYTIEAIAEECGFSNKVSFYNAFKSETGMSPKEFKSRID